MLVGKIVLVLSGVGLASFVATSSHALDCEGTTEITCEVGPGGGQVACTSQGGTAGFCTWDGIASSCICSVTTPSTTSSGAVGLGALIAGGGAIAAWRLRRGSRSTG